MTEHEIIITCVYMSTGPFSIWHLIALKSRNNEDPACLSKWPYMQSASQFVSSFSTTVSVRLSINWGWREHNDFSINRTRSSFKTSEKKSILVINTTDNNEAKLTLSRMPKFGCRSTTSISVTKKTLLSRSCSNWTMENPNTLLVVPLEVLESVIISNNSNNITIPLK